nr:immunoglobulin light chain junction region [Macaca mulatta]MPO03253.1 immunoglobulin light chain junction region [Macaca mulatta]MPO03335.1 immunoglobulin light chain junction region [Macaca mulatta]MPO03718.1 immunoglobulin light chain junction region [Macaca mulatta]MPO03819.1 immunoglobulin light chain junction region [Macaca mulatta]
CSAWDSSLTTHLF